MAHERPGMATAGGGETDSARIAHATTDDAALETLTSRLLELGGRALLVGEAGTGKSTLAARLGESLGRLGHAPACIGADPGSPGFGVPGAVCLGEWRDSGWSLLAAEALCTLDAGRFRLPLTDCVRRLLRLTRARTPLLVDGPGVVRGVAGAELLTSLVDIAGVDAVLLLERSHRQPVLRAQLHALAVPVLTLEAASQARRPNKATRARQRTQLWNAYLEHAATHMLKLDSGPVVGTPPPLEARGQWTGRQAALLDRGNRTVALGEVEFLEEGALRLRCRGAPQPGQSLLIRDARRGPSGLLGSAGPDAADAVRYVAPADVLPGAASVTGPRPVVRAGPTTAALVNGVLGDPLLHVRVHHHRRSLLFDLGEAGRLPAKLAHQVSDVFLSHAHIDHIAGFLWLVRSRMGEFPALRIFGPEGITDNIRGMLAGILWDRVENRGPRFQVAEFAHERLRRTALRAGGTCEDLDEQPAPGGVLLDEAELRVHATHLDHGHGTRVLAFALETPHTFNVRKERLKRSGLAPGPWLTRLKTLAAAGNFDEPVALPDGRNVSAGTLADDLMVRSSGVRIAYATDLADTGENRERLAHLARNAHTLFCEARFQLRDAAQAHRTGHLTTQACGAIAALTRAQRLVPFHFSRRYEDDLAGCYDEIRAAFPRTITPPLRDTGE